MNKKHGFLLLELVISMSLAAIISFTLVNTLYRANKASAALDNTMYVFSHAALAQYQLERDITTAFAPVIQIVETKKMEDIKAEENTENQAKNKEKETQKLFFGIQNSNNNLSMLTCITSSPLASYWSSKTGKPKARIARVIYRLIKDTHQPDTYTLFRQEGQNLDFDTYAADKSSGAHNYALLKNIKQCTITYKISIEKKAKAPMAQEEKTAYTTKPEIEYKTFTEWGTTKPDITKKEEPFPILPHMVTVALTLWDKEHAREYSFNFVYNIAAENNIEKKQTTNNNQVQQKPLLSNKAESVKKEQKQATLRRSDKKLARTRAQQRLIKSKDITQDITIKKITIT